jgi:hypothetical protein
VLLDILSHSDGWETSPDRMWRQARQERGEAGEGRDAVRAAFAELESAGYVRRVRKNGPRGRFITERDYYDVPAGRPELDKAASPQVAPQTADQAPVDQAPVDQAQAGQAPLRRLSTKTFNEDRSNGSSLSRARAELQALGAAGREIQEVIDHINSDPNVRTSAGPYLRGVLERGDGAEVVAKARARLAERDQAPRPGSAGKPEWCGDSECDPETRLRDKDHPYRCPRCHPLAAGQAASTDAWQLASEEVLVTPEAGHAR